MKCPTRANWLAIFALIVFAHPALPTDLQDAKASPEQEHASRIAAVENGLMPQVLVKGEPRPKWSLAERMAHYHVPGVSIAVVVDGKIAWAKGYGVLDTEKPDKIGTRTLFQAASISKPVTAVAALHLVEDGKLALDEPVNARLERWKIPENEYTKQRAVTLRDLLSHRGGTTVSGFPGYAKGAAIPTLIQVLNGESPANTPAVLVDQLPGESMRYSGGGTTIVQLLIEDVTDAPFDRYMQDHVLQPLKMTRNHFQHPVQDSNAARAHTGDKATPVVGHSHLYPELAAAGMWTTPTDLATFGLEVVKALRGDEDAYLSAATAREMLTPLDNDNPYALGFGVVDQGDGLSFGHNGGNHGFSCRLSMYHDGRGGVAIMTNSDVSYRLIREIGAAPRWKRSRALTTSIRIKKRPKSTSVCAMAHCGSTRRVSGEYASTPRPTPDSSRPRATSSTSRRTRKENRRRFRWCMDPRRCGDDRQGNWIGDRLKSVSRIAMLSRAVVRQPQL